MKKLYGLAIFLLFLAPALLRRSTTPKVRSGAFNSSA